MFSIAKWNLSHKTTGRQSHRLLVHAMQFPLLVWGTTLYINLHECSPFLGRYFHYFKKKTIMFGTVWCNHVDSYWQSTEAFIICFRKVLYYVNMDIKLLLSLTFKENTSFLLYTHYSIQGSIILTNLKLSKIGNLK